MLNLIFNQFQRRKKELHKFQIDCSQPVQDEIFDLASFEKFLHDRIKVNGKAGNLGESVTVSVSGNIITVEAKIAFSKRYLKYLSKKFLKKNQLKDWMNVLANGKNSYVLKYYRIENEEEEEAAEN